MDVNNPAGGRTGRVWVLDSTPPSMIHVASEALNHETLQVTLQLSEPGTIWCQAAELDTSTEAQNCKMSQVQQSDNSVACYFETYIKGSNVENTIFLAYVHEAYRDYDIEINKIAEKDGVGSTALRHETAYNVFCFAEDDWKLEADAAPGLSISYVSPSGPNKVTFSTSIAVKNAVGEKATLDDTPPSFTLLQIQDPTAYDSKIVVTFKLNEAGTVYCRATRSDSGETAGDMPINRILTADWSGAYSGAGTVTIAMSKLENVDPDLTVRDDEDDPIEAGTQYDIYCWARDDALDTNGNQRFNAVLDSYVGTNVGVNPLTPMGGFTNRVWVVDSTPPQIILVTKEAVGHETLQVTLQLNEPGTVWCQPAIVNSDPEVGLYCQEDQLQDVSPAVRCYFESYIKGESGHTVFRVDAHEAYRNYQIEMNRIMREDSTNSIALKREYAYHVFCFAEDDWAIEAENAPAKSSNYVTPPGPNKVDFAATQAFSTLHGLLTTLDETPPSFTRLQIQDPTAFDTKIIVTFELNEAGTAYCRATRSDSGETADDMPINRILTANWSGEYTGAGSVTIEMTKLDNVVPSLTNRDDKDEPLVQSTQYDVYCWAQDSAVDSFSKSRPNYMLQNYVGANVVSWSAPSGGATLGVWVVDASPPLMIFIHAEAVDAEDTLQVTLQLNEPGTVWCQAAELDAVAAPSTCKESEVQGTSTGLPCYYETFIKGAALHGTVFRRDVHEAYRDVDVEVNRLHGATPGTSRALSAETGHKVFCFAEDDWYLEAHSASVHSSNYAPPSGPNGITMAAATAFKDAVGLQTTLDLTPPAVSIQSWIATESLISVTLQLNEPGTALCRAVRRGFAAPTILDILDTNFLSSVPTAATNAVVVVSAYDSSGEPLVRGTDYDVYCYAEDDLCAGCRRATGITSAAMLLTQTNVRTADTTPPVLRIMTRESVARDKIRITLRVDEGARIWCAAWPAQPLNFAVTWESKIKGFAPKCHEEREQKQCGSFWVYDLDDTEDTSADGLATRSAYDGEGATPVWRHNEDLNIILSGLTEATSYNYIYCYAEDDEADGDGSSSNKMTYNSGTVAGSKITSIRTELGSVTTLDESPPSFTQLQIQDPTAGDTSIVVTFALNEPGTVYCRAVRTDAGQDASDVPVNRILTANWFAAYAGSGTATIEVSNLENVDPSLTVRDDERSPIAQATQYNVHCWARDNAVSTLGWDRFNYMQQGYVDTDVGSPLSPSGGTTSGVWVVDVTPPSVAFVAAESLDHETLQVTLQLNEPGTVWCAAVEPGTSATSCNEDDIQDTSATGPCYFERFIKGSVLHGTTFVAGVHEAFRDVDINVNRIWKRDEAAGEALQHEHGYKMFCFAEDDWAIEAQNAFTKSPNFVIPSGPNKNTLAAVTSLVGSIGIQTTLDDTPPSFTKLVIQDPTADNGRISVIFTLNEPGTAYCRATRTDSGETVADMPINRILTADWSAIVNATYLEATIDMDSLENPLTAGSHGNILTPIAEATQYDVYCWASDSATSSQGYPRSNYMIQSYVQTDIGAPLSPLGGRTPYVWVTDSTPPTVVFVAAESTHDETIQVTLQLNEPGTIWCAAAELGSGTTYCHENSFQDSSTTPGSCYFENVIKGSVSEGTTFRADVHEAFRDVDISVNRIWLRDESTSEPLKHEHMYKIMCFAEDDWAIEAQYAANSPNFVIPSGPNKVSMPSVQTLRDAIGTQTTLDDTPPSFTQLQIQDPTAVDNQIVVTFKLNEAGTAYCRASRVDSGETTADMPINRILTAQWSATYTGAAETIAISNLESADPALTGRDDEVAAIAASTQYNIYCWAQDSAQDSLGRARPQYMSQSYADTAVGAALSPAGGTTANVWVVDSTPPTMKLIGYESTDHETLQLVLQLDEPGTLWCAASELDSVGSGTTYCRSGDVQDGSTSSGSCYYETFIKGRQADATVFQAQVHAAYQDVTIEVNRIWEKDQFGSAPLAHEHAYQVLCFAEDDWHIEAVQARNSVNFVAPTSPNKVTLASVQTFGAVIGPMTTLDDTPPSFTMLKTQDPTEFNDRIIVTFTLNEDGTAYCRALRTDSGQVAADMPINRIITAGWSQVYNSSLGEANVTIQGLENVDPARTLLDDEVGPIEEARQYDVYCWAQDSAVDSQGRARPQYMLESYVSTSFSDPLAPMGGRTPGVWIVDSTPPQMIFVDAEAVTHETLQLTLQLNEPGTLWCAAVERDASSNAVNCKSSQVQDSTITSGNCYFENYIKGSSTYATVFRGDVHAAYVDVEIEVNRILAKDEGSSTALEHEVGYQILCFAEDDWAIEAAAVGGSANFVAPAAPNGVGLAAVATLRDAIGVQTTLDETAPSFTKLEVKDPTLQNDRIAVTFALNEAGTAYCRATRSDSGETFADMPINRILAAGWSATFSSGDTVITMTRLVNPTLENEADIPFDEAYRYDVYCWAQDAARTSKGLARPNAMDASYVHAAVGSSVSSPSGGTTAHVWVADTTPPQAFFVSAESVGHETLQVTLQLNEPGTLWCSAVELDTLAASQSIGCRASEMHEGAAGTACHFETVVKGSAAHGTSFRADVHAAFENVDIEINQIWAKDKSQGHALQHEQGYQVLCFAEDDWTAEAVNAPSPSPSFVAPTSANGMNLAAANLLRDVIGEQTTLDESPPSFTLLRIRDPTAMNSKIVVTFALNEPGTAYCATVRSDSGEAGIPLAINRILSAGWSSAYRPASGDSTLEIEGPRTGAHAEQLDEATRYNVYCWAKDDAKDSYGAPRPQYMTYEYISPPIVNSSQPEGGFAEGVWVVDSTPPSMVFVRWDAVRAEDTIQVTLQLNEPGTVWCAAVEPDGTAAATGCKESDLQATDARTPPPGGSGAGCYFEAYIKGGAQHLSPFKAEIPVAFVDYSLEVNRLLSKSETAVSPLQAKTQYKIYCFAEDDWQIEADNAPVHAPDYVSPLGPNKALLPAVQTLASAIGTVTTLDLTPPEIQVLSSSTAEGTIDITLALDEAGTAWCRAVGRDYAVPEVQEILETNFFTSVASAGAQGVVTISAYAGDGQALRAATDYDVYCYAEDSLCLGCTTPTGSNASAVLASKTAVRTADTTPPAIRLVGRESVARDTIHITLQVNEGSRVWCAAWTAEPANMATDYEALIKAKASGCEDTRGVGCGTFWVYDLDDLEDGSADGLTSAEQYRGDSVWRFNEDVSILLSGLTEATDYSHIYCYAEDDESTPNKMPFVGGPVEASRVSHVQNEIGVVKTLDESPPSFILLQLQDPTAAEGALIVTFSLNEAGTAYCRATQTNAGETNMAVNRILAANWQAAFTAGTATISITQLENVNPALTLRDDEVTPIRAGTQYDVYCWAQDSAVTTAGYARPNYMTQGYVDADVGLFSAPAGGRTAGVWVLDSTPPGMIFVRSESVNQETIQVVLQLNEPGTIWCAAAEQDTSPTLRNCKESWVQGVQPTPGLGVCYFENFVKGSVADGTTFLAEVHDAYSDYAIEVNAIWENDRSGSAALEHETSYKIFCFAEDDWTYEAANAGTLSSNFAAPASPNKSPFAAVTALMLEIGDQVTLDEAPPSFTSLVVQDPTASNDKIVVTFTLNEAGTTYCRAARSDSNEVEFGMPINSILAADWSAAAAAGSSTTIEMTQLARTSEAPIGFEEQQQYHVYCWARDDATDSYGVARVNSMTQTYVDAGVGSPSNPVGGLTANVWVTDATPPEMVLVRAESIHQETLQLTLQLNEPGTVWCAAGELDAAPPGINCRGTDLQDTSPAGGYCYFETYIKGSPSERTSFEVQIHEAYRDFDVEVNRIWEKDKIGSSALTHEETYQILCFAEDDWRLQASSGAALSPNFNAPSGPMKVSLADVFAFKDAAGPVRTLDDAPPSFTRLQIQDPTASNDRILVTFSLNEAGTAYCRATRTDSGETAADMPINRILTASWSANVAGAGSLATIEITNLESATPALTVRDDERASILEATQYDVYCWAQDTAVDSFSHARPNYATAAYVAADVVAPLSPAGGRTASVWVADLTPPKVIAVSSEAIAEDSIHVILQLNEPGTVWCAAALPDSASAPQFCKLGAFQDSSTTADCYFETFIKGGATDGTVFRADAHVAYKDVDIVVNRLWERDKAGGAYLTGQTTYEVLCFAEDDWQIQAAAAANSPNFVAPPGPQGISLADVLLLKDSLGPITTLDTTPPVLTLAISAPATSEDSLVVHVTVDEASTLYCQPLLHGTAAPHASRIVSYGIAYTCGVAGGCSNGELVIPNLLKGTLYDVHCHAEDDNTYPQHPNGVTAPVLSARVNDITPPIITVVRSEAPAAGLIVVTLRLDEEGTVYCYSPTNQADTVYVPFVMNHGVTSKVVVGPGGVGRNVDVHVTKRGTAELPLQEQTTYTTYCAAQDTATNPDCSSCTVPNPSTLAEIAAARDNIGLLTTLDESPPSFTKLGARGVSETQLTVTLQLNEQGTVYCRVARTDTVEPTLHINHIVQAGFSVLNDGLVESTLTIDKLASRADEPMLMSGTAYDVLCWARDSAVKSTCVPNGVSADCSPVPSPNFMAQAYVDTAFSTSDFPPLTSSSVQGGRIDFVRTWDVTPPQLIVVEAESRSETSITVTLQLNEPGTAYCRAFLQADLQALPGGPVPNFTQVADDAPGGPFSFELPSDSATRIYSAHAFRNFEVTVTGLLREALYYVYCTAQDDEASDGCSQRATSDSPACSSNQNVPVLTESSGRYTLDLTPPVISVVDAISYTQDSLVVTVLIDEAGTVWCAAVLDGMPAPTANQILAAGYMTDAPEGGGNVNVTIPDLSRDTEYDIYCFARDDGTKSAKNNTLELEFSKKNAIGYNMVLSTKRDGHVIYDSQAPVLLSTEPLHNAFGVIDQPNITLTFNEDVKAGIGNVMLKSSGQSDILVPVTDILFLNAVAKIVVENLSPPVSLATGANWRVVVPDDAIVDLAGNAFAGIADGSYNLQT
eukprot:TRINITY_DN27306_c0_g6_i1.p1 TRINITY_DN27306_c0_g6~~TRINITY_DN27306_c0_g6_i1.p1  ORF type:complete len:5181 (-),score=906.80 TRINITY_DN27306_c0_g6_i1:179-15013(-)